MSSSYEVFIPFSNEKVWVPALGAMGILLRIREKILVGVIVIFNLSLRHGQLRI
jgi:hypothetical protein